MPGFLFIQIFSWLAPSELFKCQLFRGVFSWTTYIVSTFSLHFHWSIPLSHVLTYWLMTEDMFISCRFPLSLYFTSILKDSFTDYRILGWRSSPKHPKIRFSLIQKYLLITYYVSAYISVCDVPDTVCCRLPSWPILLSYLFFHQSSLWVRISSWYHNLSIPIWSPETT